MSESDHEFYIGYLPRAPRDTAKRVRRAVVIFVIGAALAAVLFVWGQRKFPVAVFEFQQYREFEGTVRERPYPALVVARPGEGLSNNGERAASQFLLVGEGKHGAHAAVSGFDGQRVKLRGALIYRDGEAMIEVVPRSVQRLNSNHSEARENEIRVSAAHAQDLGVLTLVGEIVDGKCYLGVMNPGSSKPHRDCAVRCISGGAPPLFIAHDADDATASLLLVSANGEPVNRAVLDFVAEPVEITGRVLRDGEQLYLRADLPSYRRVK